MIIEKIKTETGIDVTKKGKKREYSELKALASYLFRQKGYTLNQIGNELNLSYVTIIHHLKNYPIIKNHNPRIEKLEYKITGKVPDNLVDELELKINNQELEIRELKQSLSKLKSNKNIDRLCALLVHEDIQEKFEAFLNINEKARYYKKY